MKKRLLLIAILWGTAYYTNAQNCLGNQGYTITPPGPYTPGQTVTVTYSLDNFIQININWIHCFDLDLGAGWASVNPISAPQNPGGSSGSWVWDNQHTFASGINFGPGWRFANSSVPNWGTSSTGPFNMSFELTVSQNCTPQNLDIRMETYGDCQTGGWSNGACCAINPYTIYTGTSLAAGVVSISDSINNVSCYGYNDGSIYLNTNGGLTPYIYQWSNGATTSNLTNIGPGTYSVTITDAAGCVSTLNGIIVAEPNQIQINASSIDVDCFGNNNGSINLAISGGVIPFTYQWSNGATTQNISNLSGGTYFLTTIDNNGCSLTNSYYINEPTLLSSITTSTNVSCNGLNDGSITINISGGITDYTINSSSFSQVLTGGINTFSTLSILPANMYPFTIADSNGCIIIDTIIITEPDLISVIENTQDVSCFGLNDGSSILTISGGTPIYNENWGGLTNPLSLSGGIYNYIITDNNGCIFTDSILINEPLLLYSNYSQINVSTCLGSDGAIDVSVNGGTNPYSFIWNNGQTTEDLTNITSGNYALTITDTNGCIDTFSTYITEPSAALLSATSINVSCFGINNGSIDLTVNGGTPPFIYLWSNNATTEDLTNIPAGIYSVAVTDSNNCISTLNITVNQPTNVSVITTISHVSCFGGNDGIASLTLSGGYPPYNTNWGGNNPDSLSAGTYTYIVTDSLNCIDTGSVTITEPPMLDTNPTITNVRCKDENNGTATLNTTGGIPPYSEDWGIYNPLNLTAGIYPYTITDFNGCTFTNTVTITEPDSLLASHITTNVKCFGGDNGTASLTITGGTIPYNIDWGLNDPNNLTAGIHTYLITDTNGCIYGNQLTITEPLDINIIIDTFGVSCFGLSDGSAILIISGATPPYNTTWNGLDPNSLPAGTHNFIVRDSNNCSYQREAIISEPNDILITKNITNVKCFGENNGSIILSISGGTPPYDTTWNGGYNNSTLSKGIYTYNVIDNNGCEKNDYFNITEPDTLTATATIIHVNCFNNDNGKVYLSYKGGTPPFTEDWGMYNPLALYAGNYAFNLIDANGCTFDSNIVINQVAEILVSFSAESPICKNDTTSLSIDIVDPKSLFYNITISDGYNNYQYLIDSNGVLFNQEQPINMTPNQDVQLIITSIEDNQGCINNPNITTDIIVYQPPTINLNLNDFCEQDSSFILHQAIPSGGTYSINGKIKNYFDIENLPTGAYNIKYSYTDSITLCSSIQEKTIYIHPKPEALFTFNPKIIKNLDTEVYFISNNLESTSFYWYIINKLDTVQISDSISFWYKFNRVGTQYIKLVVNNIYGCTDTLIDSLEIIPNSIIYVPTAFTPNDDNINDIFGPEINNYQTYRISIFNKWGGVIFNQENQNWDGRINGKIAPIGIYFYFIEIIDLNNKITKYSGQVLLKR